MRCIIFTKSALYVSNDGRPFNEGATIQDGRSVGGDLESISSIAAGKTSKRLGQLVPTELGLNLYIFYNEFEIHCYKKMNPTFAFFRYKSNPYALMPGGNGEWIKSKHGLLRMIFLSLQFMNTEDTKIVELLSGYRRGKKRKNSDRNIKMRPHS